MLYRDKNNKEIEAGMKILMPDGNIEIVHNICDTYGNADLGINASNEDFLNKHPDWPREYYSLSAFNTKEMEIIT